jgi:homoserine dehydrogenase
MRRKKVSAGNWWRRPRGRSGKVWAKVGPERLPLSDPLSQVLGVLNALTLEFDPLGAITVIGPGAGPEVTGHAILSDLLAIHRGLR